MAAEDVAVPVEVAAPAPALGEPMDIMTALQLVLRKSLAHGGLVRGLHGAAKVIEKHAAQLCVLAEDCDQPDYIKLVKALCADHNVSLVTVPSAKTLGEWAGLCKIDSEGKARKVVGCSCLVVKAGRLENVVGWYHSHPGYGCWLSGIDVSTQMLNQQYQEPFLAVVIDPTRTMSAGKVEIGAFRTYPDGYKPSDEPVSEY